MIYGFLPAAARLGLEVLLLTNQPEAHEHAITRAHGPRAPGPARHDSRGHAPRGQAPWPPAAPAGPGPVPPTTATAIPCPGAPQYGPHRPRPVAGSRRTLRPLGRSGADRHDRRAARPAAVFTNSDHLQTQTALAADYFGLPGKDSALGAARQRQGPDAARGSPIPVPNASRCASLSTPAGRHPRGLAYPVVLKPATGVASEDVVLVHQREELARRSAGIFARRPVSAWSPRST